jgi:hypothetical protein
MKLALSQITATQRQTLQQNRARRLQARPYLVILSLS